MLKQIRCLIANEYKKLKAALKIGKNEAGNNVFQGFNIDGKFTSTEDFLTLSTKERKELLGKVLNKNSVDFLNAKFERIYVKEKDQIIEKFLSEAFANAKIGKDRIQSYREQLQSIKKPLSEGKLYEVFEDIISKEIGIDLSKEEFKKLSELSEKLMDAHYALKKDKNGEIERDSSGMPEIDRRVTYQKDKDGKNVLDKLGNPIPATKINGEKINEYGNPTEEYWKGREELENYLKALNPSSKMDVLFGTILPGNLLARPSSVLLNVQGSALFGAGGAAKRRAASLLKGDKASGLNSDLVADYAKNAASQYAKTGFDAVTMTTDNLKEDTRKVLGQKTINPQGEGAMRAVGRFYNKYVFRIGQGVSDVYFMALHFADSANLTSTNMAYQEGIEKGITDKKQLKEYAKKRSYELMKDSMKINPDTKEGKDIRAKAQEQAMYYTFKNKSLQSEIGLKSRELITAFGKAIRFPQLGKTIIPFIVTNANLQKVGIGHAGGYGVGSVIKALDGAINFVKGTATKDARKKAILNEKSAADFTRSLQLIAQQVPGGIAFALLYTFLKDIVKEYMPDYPSATEEEKEYARRYKIPFNSVRVGNSWISLDFLGIFAPMARGILHAKRSNDGHLETVWKYALGIAGQALEIPGFKEVANFTADIAKTQEELEEGEVSKKWKDVIDSGVDLVVSRMIPGIIVDIAKSIDKVERERKGGTVLSNLGKGLGRQIPFVSKLVDSDLDIFGDEVKSGSDNWIGRTLGTLLLGSRVRNTPDTEKDPIHTELTRLLAAREYPKMRELQYANKAGKEVAARYPKRFREAAREFGTKFKTALQEEFDSEEYQKATDGEKRNSIKKIQKELTDQVTFYGQKTDKALSEYLRLKSKKKREEDEEAKFQSIKKWYNKYWGNTKNYSKEEIENSASSALE